MLHVRIADNGFIHRDSTRISEDKTLLFWQFSDDVRGFWASRYQMSINGKRDSFTEEDLSALALIANIKPNRAKEMRHRIISTVQTWSVVGQKAGIAEDRFLQIKSTQRLSFLESLKNE